MPSFINTPTASCDHAAQRPAARQQLEIPPGQFAVEQRQTIGVLHLITGQYFAGAERVQDLLALRLPEEGFHLAFACVKPGQFASSRKSQVPIYKVPMAFRGDLRAAVRIARIARAERYRLLHAHTVRTAMVGRIASLLAGLPMVYHVHSPTARNTTRPVLNRIAATVERWSLAGVAHLIAVSESLARHMQSQGFAPQRISVVYNGVPALARLPERSCPQGHWNIGVIALFRPRKGIEVLLQALALLKQQGVRFTLHAIGDFQDCDYQRQIKRSAAELGLTDNVQWHGFVQDVNTELARLDMLVLPSLFGEGLPMVVLEAMAAGVPVVATDVEGVGEAIRHGQEGILVRPGEPQSLASAISFLTTGEVSWTGLRLAAWRRQQEMFSDRSMAAGVAAVYRRVLRWGAEPTLP